MNLMLINSHCHLDYFTGDELAGVLARAAAAGVGEMVTIGTRLASRDAVRGIGRRRMAMSGARSACIRIMRRKSRCRAPKAIAARWPSIRR